MNEISLIKDLQGVEVAMRKELEHIAEGYIVVGYLLKKTRDDELFREKGYVDVFDFAKQTFNISRTWAVRFMQINDTYSIDGNSPEIQEKYRGYGSSKLSEMLTLPEEIREEVPKSATVKEIREVKEIIRETEDRYVLQRGRETMLRKDGPLAAIGRSSGRWENRKRSDGNRSADEVPDVPDAEGERAIWRDNDQDHAV